MAGNSKRLAAAPATSLGTAATTRRRDAAPRVEQMMISDDYDFPPAPKREAFVMCLVAALFLALVGWGLGSLAFMGLRSACGALALSGCVTAEEMAAQDSEDCHSYGAATGTEAYFQCRMVKTQQHIDASECAAAGINQAIAQIAANQTPLRPM
jgi:hypothetical protein